MRSTAAPATLSSAEKAGTPADGCPIVEPPWPDARTATPLEVDRIDLLLPASYCSEISWICIFPAISGRDRD
jgi:hypothetical protein